MDFLKVTVSVDGRDVDISVKRGAMATAEFGAIIDGAEVPKSRVAVIADIKSGTPVAWTQVSKYDGNSFVIEGEGWLGESVDRASIVGNAVNGGVSYLETTEESHIDCLKEAEFGILACCTSSAGSCYVRCCGGCCSDPYGCPGASCCP